MFNKPFRGQALSRRMMHAFSCQNCDLCLRMWQERQLLFKT